MKTINNFNKKNDALFKILRNHLWDKDKDEFNYLDDSSELLFLIEDVLESSVLAKKIESYYLINKIDDKFSNYEEICKIIATEYLVALKKIDAKN